MSVPDPHRARPFMAHGRAPGRCRRRAHQPRRAALGAVEAGAARQSNAGTAGDVAVVVALHGSVHPCVGSVGDRFTRY